MIESRVREFTEEEARRAIANARWAERIGVTYAALSLWVLPNIRTPAELKAVVLLGLILAGINGARRSGGEREAMERFP